MSFELLLCGVLAAYGLSNFVLLPRLTKAWNANRRTSKIAKTGVLAFVQFVRDTAFVAAAIYVAFALLTLVLGFSFGSNATFLEWMVASADRMHESLDRLSTLWSHWFFMFPLALLAYLCWRSQRNEVNGRFERVVDDELDRLNRERAQNPQQWNELAPDEEIRAIDEQLAQARQQLSSLSPESPRAERRRLQRLIQALHEKRTDLDYERRLNLAPLDVAEQAGSQAKWERLLLSKGLFSDLKGFSKVLGRVTLALLAVALIGVAGSAGLTKDVWNRVIHLDELRVEATKESAKERWDKHPPAQQQQASLNDSDRQAIQHLARDFSRAFASNPNWNAFRASLRAQENAEHSIARRAILNAVTLPDAEGAQQAAFGGGISSSDHELLRDISSGHHKEGRVAGIIADRHGSEVKSWFGERWESTKAAILQHAAAYQEPVAMEDLQGELIDRIVAVAFDATEPEGASEWAKHAREGMSDASKEAVREAVETEFRKVVEDLYDGKPYHDIMAKVRSDDIPISKAKVEDLSPLLHDRRLPNEPDLTERMAASTGEWKDRNPSGGGGPNMGGSGSDGSPGPHPGGEKGPTPTGQYSSGTTMAAASEGSADSDAIVEQIAHQYTASGRHSLSEDAVGALAEYEDHFPRSVASQSSTRLGRVLQRYSVSGDAPALARAAELKVARASSFTMLRGFSKVGGVLIGKEPKGSADIRDIRWVINGRNVSIALVDASGHQTWIGPFDKGLVHQALAYAADGRPVAVTMTIANPVPDLKIFLHPSLVDTPLGCRVQQLDRLVDTYAGRQLPIREKLTEDYEGQVAVYNVALSNRLLVIADKIDAQHATAMRQAAKGYISQYSEAAKQGLSQPGLFSSASILRKKSEFFEPGLIKTAKSCQNTDLDAFQKCVRDTYESSREMRELKEEVLRTWAWEPTTIEPWSGVRERSYEVSNDLGFLKAPKGSTIEDSLWPFDFMVQVAFTSAAVNLPAKEQELYVDRQPIEFDQIKPDIEKLVNAGIQQDGFISQFEDLRNFAILQRLFRSALDGNLGSKFPTLKLAQLTSDTGKAVPYFHTRRWNSSQLYGGLAAMERARPMQDQPWMQRAAMRLSACEASLRRTIADPAHPGQPGACDFSEFKQAASKACPMGTNRESSGCIWRAVVRFSEVLPELQETEIAFGVLDDERRSSSDVNCPSLAPASVSLAATR